MSTAPQTRAGTYACSVTDETTGATGSASTRATGQST
jgi:hypothetical protein